MDAGQYEMRLNRRIKSRAQVRGVDGLHAQALSAGVRRDAPLANVLAVLTAVRIIGAPDLMRVLGRKVHLLWQLRPTVGVVTAGEPVRVPRPVLAPGSCWP